MKPVRFTSHAEAKLVVLAQHGCLITRADVLEVLNRPEALMEGHRSRKIAQGPLGADHVLRVVFEQRESETVVVTFYPGRRSRYESSIQS